jgi:hypothetical protein
VRPYPWRERQSFHERRVLADLYDKIGHILFWPALVMSLGTSALLAIWARQGFTRNNDAWWKRGLIILGVGIVLMPFLGGPVQWFHALLDLFYSLGKYAKMSWQEALRNLLLAGVPIAFIFQGIASMAAQYRTEYMGERFIMATRPTFLMRNRMKKNVKDLSSGKHAGNGWLQFGVIEDDPIPWRTPRYGMICERPIERLGHGCIVGGNGTGKTVLASNLVDQAASSGTAVLYVDYKASLDTYRATRAAAQNAGVSFYSFDLGIGSGETTWYDPLAWEGTPSDKSSMLVQSFNFSDTGDASYYKNIAEQYLTLQFEVMDYVGLREHESRFDFLLRTAMPNGLRERLDVLKGGTDEDLEALREWTARAATIKSEALSSLRANLSTVVNSGGERLRPQDDAPAVSLARIAEEGGVIYVGLSPSTNEVALKIIGSLVLRDLGVLAGERMRVPNKGSLRPMIAFVDEASRMGSRAVVMDNLFATAREGLIALWPITQSFSTWPASTQVEMNTNVQTHVTFRVQDPATATLLAGTLEPIRALSEMREVETHESMLEGASSSMTGGSRQTMVDMPFIPAGRLGSMDNYVAYVWFSGSRNRATKRTWKSRRVRNDQVKHDAPLVRIIPASRVINPPEPELKGQTFSDMAPSLATSRVLNDDTPAVATDLAPTNGGGFMSGFSSDALDAQRSVPVISETGTHPQSSGATAVTPAPQAEQWDGGHGGFVPLEAYGDAPDEWDAGGHEQWDYDDRQSADPAQPATPQVSDSPATGEIPPETSPSRKNTKRDRWQ